MTIGEQIKAFRKKIGYTQKQLAEKCEVAEITIRQYESDKRQPRIEQLHKIASVLEVPIWTLLGISKQDALLAYGSDYFNHTGYETSKLSQVIKKDILYETQFNKLKESYNSLNSLGQKEAVKRIKELTEIPRYTKKGEPASHVNAAHPIPGASEEDKQHDENIMDDDNF